MAPSSVYAFPDWEWLMRGSITGCQLLMDLPLLHYCASKYVFHFHRFPIICLVDPPIQHAVPDAAMLL
jgi:hypothetical protein